MLDFPIHFKLGPVRYFRPKLSQIPHDALKLRRAPGKFIYQRAEIGLLVRVEPITNNAKTSFQRFEVILHPLRVAFLKNHCKPIKIIFV
jgi:hypothetical protein